MLKFKDIWNNYKRNSSVKDCFYHNKTSCSQKVIKAHSIQKEKILSQLEYPINGNNLIYSLNDYEVDINLKPVKLIPIGKKESSVFTGFCDYHDSMLFSPIENFPFSGSQEQLFLLTYRGFAHGYHQLMEMYKYLKSSGGFFRFLKSNIFLTQFRIQKFHKYKTILDTLFENRIFGGINYHCRVIEKLVPIACSSVLSPFYTYKNIFLNPNEEYSYLVLTIIPDYSRTIILISHFEEDTKGKIFFDEFQNLSIKEFTEVISSLMIYSTSNTFFSPLLWNKFDTEMKKQLYLELDYCTKHGDKIKRFFKSKINFFEIE